MKVLILNRNPNYGNFGGDLVHASALADALTHNGVPARVGSWDEESKRLIAEADVIHVFNCQFQWALMFAELARAHGKKVVLQMIFNPEAKSEALLSREDQNRVLEFADAIVVSGSIELSLMKRYYQPGTWEEKVHSIPNAARSEFYCPEEKTDLNAIVAVGRLEKRKNLMPLAQAAFAVGMPLRLVGMVPCEAWKEERAYCDELSRVPGVSIIGFRTEGALIDEYRRANILAMPSFYETDGMTHYEGALAGCNLLLSENTESATTLRGFEEVRTVDPEATPYEFAVKLRELAFRNQGCLREWARENRTWETVSKLYIETYEAL